MKIGRSRWWIAAAIAFAVVLVAVIALDVIVAMRLPDSQDHLRGELFGLLTPLAVVVAGVGALLTFEETRRQNLRTLSVTNEQLNLQRRGQVADRFAKAIEQLGNRNQLDLRVGAVYSLEAVARESTEWHWPTMEVLTAFIRQYSSWSEDEAPLIDPPSVPADIQAAITVIGQRKREQDQGFLDLQGVDLRSADLAGAQLQKADLRGAHLEMTTLSAQSRIAYLQEANLCWAHLEGARVSGAVLTRANLRFAHLEGARLASAWLDCADLGEAYLQRADLGGAHLEGANLFGAHIDDADLTHAYLHGANRDVDPATIPPGFYPYGPIVTIPSTILPDLREVLKDPGNTSRFA
jgi:pentapeptide repeat protein